MKRYLLLIIVLLNSLDSNAQEIGLDQRIDEAFKPISDFFSSVVFFEIAETPFVILLLVGSAIFFTAYFGFPNIRENKINGKKQSTTNKKINYKWIISKWQ